MMMMMMMMTKWTDTGHVAHKLHLHVMGGVNRLVGTLFSRWA